VVCKKALSQLLEIKKELFAPISLLGSFRSREGAFSEKKERKGRPTGQDVTAGEDR